jgi:hypothetical protein
LKKPKKAGGVDKDAGDPKDAGADAKPAPGGGGE